MHCSTGARAHRAVEARRADAGAASGFGIQVRIWPPNERRSHLAVSGSYRVRLRGTSETYELPFSHVWSFADGRVKDVLDAAEGFELRRLPPAAPRAT